MHLDSLSSLGNLSDETSSDGLHGASGTTSLALDKVQSVLLFKNSVLSFAVSTRNILSNIILLHILQLTSVEATTNNETLVTIKGTCGSQLGQGVGQQVINRAVHVVCSSLKVVPHGLLGASEHLGDGQHGLALLGDQVGVSLLNHLEHTSQQLLVGMFFLLGLVSNGIAFRRVGLGAGIDGGCGDSGFSHFGFLVLHGLLLLGGSLLLTLGSVELGNKCLHPSSWF